MGSYAVGSIQIFNRVNNPMPVPINGFRMNIDTAAMEPLCTSAQDDQVDDFLLPAYSTCAL